MGLVIQERDIPAEPRMNPYNVNSVSRAYREFLPTPAGQDYLANLRPLETPEWAQIAATPVLRPYLDTASRLSLPDWTTPWGLLTRLNEPTLGRRSAPSVRLPPDGRPDSEGLRASTPEPKPSPQRASPNSAGIF